MYGPNRNPNHRAAYRQRARSTSANFCHEHSCRNRSRAERSRKSPREQKEGDRIERKIETELISILRLSSLLPKVNIIWRKTNIDQWDSMRFCGPTLEVDSLRHTHTHAHTHTSTNTRWFACPTASFLHSLAQLQPQRWSGRARRTEKNDTDSVESKRCTRLAKN